MNSRQRKWVKRWRAEPKVPLSLYRELVFSSGAVESSKSDLRTILFGKPDPWKLIGVDWAEPGGDWSEDPEHLRGIQQLAEAFGVEHRKPAERCGTAEGIDAIRCVVVE